MESLSNQPINPNTLAVIGQIALRAANIYVKQGIRESHPRMHPLDQIKQEKKIIATLQQRFEDRVKEGDPFLYLEVALLEAVKIPTDRTVANEGVQCVEEYRLMWSFLADRIEHANTAELMGKFLSESDADRLPYVGQEINPVTNQEEIMSLVPIAGTTSIFSPTDRSYTRIYPSRAFIEETLKKLCPSQPERSLEYLESAYDDHQFRTWRTPLLPTSIPDVMIRYIGPPNSRLRTDSHVLIAYFTPPAIEKAISFTR